ncbi:hypothetical protein BCR44DRAFT_311281 [Catenaria anguillulae PL171]|uniref:Uncharacterized protein n=1 Tax=Catenaria anguillulae PL171 TaxID=765915 RepID=A0A1Y2HX55_9FUNG|nr:hypothetical protein BCR44DRAFT_311281 [Catenaria anguillulae PL171]
MQEQQSHKGKNQIVVGTATGLQASCVCYVFSIRPSCPAETGPCFSMPIVFVMSLCHVNVAVSRHVQVVKSFMISNSQM